jgi:hypothetical protein
MRHPALFNNIAIRQRLEHYYRLSDAVSEFPFIDDILTGVCNLDLGGNTKPLSISRMFHALAAIDTIGTRSVMDAYQCSESHARKLASALRIASRALHNEFSNPMQKHVKPHGTIRPRPERCDDMLLSWFSVNVFPGTIERLG